MVSSTARPSEPIERFDLDSSEIRNLTRLRMSDSGLILALDFVAGSHQIVELDSTFRFVSTIGRFGRGPGEYQMPADVEFTTNDGVFLLDMGNQKLMHFFRGGEKNWEHSSEHTLQRKERFMAISAAYMYDRFYVLYSELYANRDVNSFSLYSYDNRFLDEQLVLSFSTDHRINQMQPHGSNYMKLIAKPPYLFLNNNLFDEMHIVDPVARSIKTHRFKVLPPSSRMKNQKLPSNRHLITKPIVTPSYYWISFEDDYFIYDRLKDDQTREIWFHDIETGLNAHLLDIQSSEMILSRHSQMLYTVEQNSDGTSYVHLYDLSRSN